MIEIRRLHADVIDDNLLSDFCHRQVITKLWARRNSGWRLTSVHEAHGWDQAKKALISRYLRRQAGEDGAVLGAYREGVLVGFVCVDGALSENDAKYANLSFLFVDDKNKRQGIGKSLFQAACVCAKDMGADKLFLSAVASYETIAFYFQMGCVDAAEIVDEFVDTENDRCLEYCLRPAPPSAY